MTYEELSRPFRTRTIPDRYGVTERNPLYQPVYPNLDAALAAKERVLKKKRSPEMDYVIRKIVDEIFWYFV